MSIPGKYEINRTGSRFTLEINNITPEDTGVYSIIATNKQDSRRQLLKLAVRSGPNISIITPELFQVHSEVNISCRVLGFPAPSIVWLYKDCDLLIDRDCDQASEVPVSVSV